MATSPENINLDPVHPELLEVGLKMFVEPRMPEFQNPISEEGKANIQALVLPVIKEASLALMPLISGNGATEQEHEQLQLLQDYTITPLGESLDKNMPLAVTRKGDMWPDTFRTILSATGNVQLARAEADKQIGWADWIRRMSQDLTLAVVPLTDEP